MKLLFLIIVSMQMFFIDSQEHYKLPGIKINAHQLQQVRRGHLHVAQKLKEYENKRITRYGLYLSVKNYANLLENLKKKIIQGIGNYISGDNNMVYGTKNVILGSNSKIAGTQNWVVSQREISSEEIQHNILYFKKWRIKLDDVSLIQKRPRLVIENIDDEDKKQLRNYRNIRALERFRNKRWKRWKRWHS